MAYSLAGININNQLQNIVVGAKEIGTEKRSRKAEVLTCCHQDLHVKVLFTYSRGVCMYANSFNGLLPTVAFRFVLAKEMP